MKKIWLSAVIATTFLSTSSGLLREATAQQTKQNVKTKVPDISKLLGSWQGLTRMQRYDEPMFTFTLKSKGVWSDLLLWCACWSIPA